MPDRDPLQDLPSLVAFGERLEDAAARHLRPGPEPARPGSASGRRFGRALLTAAVLLGVAGTSATATVLALRAAEIPGPDPSIVPAEQLPRDGAATVLALRSTDPAGQDPWALRRSVGRTGLPCTTVGQVRDGAFGLVGQDGVFRSLSPAIVDACGQGVLLGARVVAPGEGERARSVVYGVAEGATKVELRTSSGARELELGPGGAFLAAMRGYPEDQALEVAITDARGRETVRSLGRRPSLVPDLEGEPAWKLQVLALGTRARCAQLRDARRELGGVDARQVEREGFPDSSTPTACLDPRGDVPVVADARRFSPGDRGRPGFDRWTWRRRSERTVVWGTVRRSGLARSVSLVGAGSGARPVTVAPNGAFGVVLPATVAPDRIRLRVELADGTVRTVRPGAGLVPDLVESRRPR